MPDMPMSKTHHQAILDVLHAAHTAVKSAAEVRYPNDAFRQSAYASIVFEDAAFAVKTGIQLGMGLAEVIAQVEQVHAEEFHQEIH